MSWDPQSYYLYQRATVECLRTKCTEILLANDADASLMVDAYIDRTVFKHGLLHYSIVRFVSLLF